MVRCLSPLSINSLSPRSVNSPPLSDASKGKAPASSVLRGPRRARGGAAPDLSEVTPRLFVGSLAAACDAQALAARGITHMLNCTNQPRPLDDFASSPKHYLSLGLLDSTADLPRMQHALEEGVRFVADAMESGGRVLVYCHRGISRSCALTMAYLMWAHRRTAESVFAEVRRARTIVDPNLGYWVCLKEWEQRVLDLTAADGVSPEPSVSSLLRPSS